MSLIHEALEKLDQEKGGTGKKSLPEILENLPSPPLEGVSAEREKNFFEENVWVIYWIGGALLFLFVLGLVYLLGKSTLKSSPSLDPASPVVSVPMSQSRFALTGITQMGREGTAIVNNELVRVGDGVGGATVKAIQDDQVVLDLKGQSVTLNLYGEERNR